MQWENTTNEKVLERAREEIWAKLALGVRRKRRPSARKSFDRKKLPGLHDPFAGGGSLPLEAQRLGLESHAGDLNPVAVLINKAMIEIPPKFAGKPPMNPSSARTRVYSAVNGRVRRALAEDIRYYGQWMRDQAERRIGHLYPKIEMTEEMVDAVGPDTHLAKKLTVVAWVWARTVKSPNPAFAKRGCAAYFHLLAFNEGGQGGVCRAGYRGMAGIGSR